MARPEFLGPVEFSHHNRKNATLAERALWSQLRASKTGFKFTRQFGIGSFFADFCCRQRKVVVEVDGSSHDHKVEEDAQRDGFLRSQGYEVLRFTNLQVFEELGEVVEKIAKTCEARPQWRY